MLRGGRDGRRSDGSAGLEGRPPPSEWGLNNSRGGPPRISWGLCQAPVKQVLGPFLLVLRTASPGDITPLSSDFMEFGAKVSVGKDVTMFTGLTVSPKAHVGLPKLPALGESGTGFTGRFFQHTC